MRLAIFSTEMLDPLAVNCRYSDNKPVFFFEYKPLVCSLCMFRGVRLMIFAKSISRLYVHCMFRGVRLMIFAK